MGYTLNKPFTNKQRADFICGHQGLTFIENDKAIYMLEPWETILDGVISGSEDDEAYQAKLTEQANVARVGAKPLFPENPFGEIYTADNTAAQTIPTGTDYTKCNAFNTAGEYRGVSLDAANNKMTLTSAGYYMIGITASSKLGTAGVTLKTALFLGGVKVPSCQAVRKINNANDESTVSFGGIVKVDTANSEIDVRVSHDNGGDVSLTTVFCNLNAVYIGDLTL